MGNIQFIPIDDLKPHEEVKPKKAEQYAKFLSRARKHYARPILIDEKTKVILDGHHRWYALKDGDKLGQRAGRQQQERCNQIHDKLS